MTKAQDRSTIAPLRIRMDGDYGRRLKVVASGPQNRSESNAAETIVKQWLDGNLVSLAEVKEMLLKILVEKVPYEQILVPRPRGLEAIINTQPATGGPPISPSGPTPGRAGLKRRIEQSLRENPSRTGSPHPSEIGKHKRGRSEKQTKDQESDAESNQGDVIP